MIVAICYRLSDDTASVLTRNTCMYMYLVPANSYPNDAQLQSTCARKHPQQLHLSRHVNAFRIQRPYTRARSAPWTTSEPRSTATHQFLDNNDALRPAILTMHSCSAASSLHGATHLCRLSTLREGVAALSALTPLDFPCVEEAMHLRCSSTIAGPWVYIAGSQTHAQVWVTTRAE